ncbi:MAG: outer membrane beta-barrel protein [Opitutaceae bacterium]
MKNKIAIASAFLAASSFSSAEIVINDFLSFEGFVDMSYTHLDGDVDGAGESENSFQVDQVEISWLFDFDPVTAQIDLQYEDPNGNDRDEVEQAFATYHMDYGGKVTAGRYASMIGFEAFEPTGLYQYSAGYDAQVVDSVLLPGGIGDVTIIPSYAQGVKYTHESENTFFGISIQDQVFDGNRDRLGGDDGGSYGVEVAYSVTSDSGLSWFIGGAYEDADLGDSYMVNTYLTFETGTWIFAAELSYGESESDAFALGGLAPFAGTGEDEEALQGLLMANFAYSEVASVTGRITYVKHELGAFELEGLKYTVAHGYAFTDNLFLVNEISYADGEIEAGGTLDGDSVLFASELIFSF